MAYLRPDGKTQVTIGYDGDEAVTLDTIVVSSQHSADVTAERLEADIVEQVIEPIIAPLELDRADLKILVNPSGRFEIGGPKGDAGLTEIGRASCRERGGSGGE